MLVSELLKKPFEPRRYQETIFAQATMHNTLVVLPTGLGKTMIAVLLAAHRLREHPESKILILAPTKPLAQQHERTFREFLDLPDASFALFTGAVSPDKRAAQWHAAQVIFSTPQGLENDLIGSRIRLSDVSLVVFDEAHRAVGDYSYVFLAKQYERQASHQRILALTASPGTSEEEIREVCGNLHIEEIEVRSQTDADVAPYVQETEVTWVRVDLPPEFAAVRTLLSDAHQSRLEALKAIGALPSVQFAGKRTLLELQGRLQGELSKGLRDPETMKAVSVAAEALKIGHAIELLDTQGLSALAKYFRGMSEQAAAGQSKAVVNVVSDVRVKTARIKTDALIAQDIEHPKLRELRRIVLQHAHRAPDIKIIIFTQYRDQAASIIKAVRELNVGAELFVGQQKKEGSGMSQKEQRAMLDRFAAGGFPVLVATSVAEEGLDIPKVDLVMFYEPVPSAIRTVQRRGRTGRGEKGQVIVLMATGTSDEGYKWSAHHKEKRMYRAITEIKRTFRKDGSRSDSREQRNLLQAYHSEKKEQTAVVISEQLAALKIVGDYREKASPVMKELVEAGVGLELKQLAVGDYHLSDRVVVEYKQVVDFVDSILDGRLLAQLKSLRQYTRPIILVEGEADIYAVRRVHPNAIRGMLATIAVSFNIPILWSRSPRETAGLLIALARREQAGGAEFQYHAAKPPSDEELMEYIIAAFPGIGSQLSRPLLERFGSIRGVVNATQEELREVDLIGEKKAKRIDEIAGKEYGSPKRDS